MSATSWRSSSSRRSSSRSRCWRPTFRRAARRASIRWTRSATNDRYRIFVTSEPAGDGARGHRSAPHPLYRSSLEPRRGGERGQHKQQDEPGSNGSTWRHEGCRGTRRRGGFAAEVENRRQRSQLGCQRRRRLVPLVQALRERPQHNRVHFARQRRVHRPGCRPGRLHNLQRERRGARPDERQLPGQHLEQDDAERKNIGPMIDLFAERLFGRHVGDRARHRGRTGRRRRGGPGRVLPRRASRGPRRQTEVEDLRVALGRDDDVGGLDVAMDDAFGLRVGERVGNLNGEIDRAAGVHRPSANHALQRLAGDELERQKDLPLILADLIQRRDVGVGQRRGRARVEEKPLAASRIIRDLRRKHPDRDGTAEPRVPGAVDLTHPASADTVQDLVVPDALGHGTATIIMTGPAQAGLYTSPAAQPAVSYLSLLRTNRNFRLLYMGQTISQLGDWFNAVAVFALLLDLTGSATAVAWMLIVQFLPVAVVGPLAGVVVDRVNRRRLMIVTDLMRGCLVLVLLVVRRPDQVWIAYVVMAFIVGAQGFFEPARTATIPNVTSAEQLMPANALSSATWAAMLALGASIGGLVTAVAGRNVAFIVNALSFFASAYFIARTQYDATPPDAARPTGLLALTGITDLLEGMRYV